MTEEIIGKIEISKGMTGKYGYVVTLPCKKMDDLLPEQPNQALLNLMKNWKILMDELCLQKAIDDKVSKAKKEELEE